MTSIAEFSRFKIVNQWGLFLLLCSVMTFFNTMEMGRQDISTPEGVSAMIGYSVRWAVPFIYCVVAISSIKILFPGTLASWLMRNRKYVGLVFAYAMAWQAVFIYILSTFHRDYYFSYVYFFRDEIEGSIGYIFLAAMVLTSFNFARRKVTSEQWSLIQKGGVYFLWAYPFSVYWWNLFYYPYEEGYSTPELHDYVFYIIGFVAFALRIIAWGKLRWQRCVRASGVPEIPLVQKFFGWTVVAFSLIVAATGNYWFTPVSNIIAGPEWSAETTLWLPFWPLEPFFSLLIMAAGIAVMTTNKYSVTGQSVRASL